MALQRRITKGLPIMEMAAGQNVVLPHTRVTISTSAELDLVALVLDDDGKVSGDADMVFFNQPSTRGVALTGPNELTVDVDQLRPAATRVVLVASPGDAAMAFGDVSTAPRIRITCGAMQATFDVSGLTVERAVNLAEVYLRNGDWKIRAVGQGYASGLAGIAAEHGVDLADEPVIESAPQATPANLVKKPRVSLSKGEESLPPDLRKAVSLRKHLVADVLESHQMLGLQCRVVLVTDVSGSTARLYKNQVFARAVERLVPVAAQIDDGAEMQAWIMGSKPVRLPDLTLAGMPTWIDEHMRKRPTYAGGANNEVAVMRDVRAYVAANPLDIPTLVVFLHDGGVTDNRGVEREVRDCDGDPIFWQFVGLGRSNYGILERLDNLEGRKVDNTGFFALDDIDKVSDPVLYSRLLHEFPDWMRAYYPTQHTARASLMVGY